MFRSTIDKVPGGGRIFLSRGCWKSVEVRDNVIDIARIDAVTHLVIQNINIQTRGKTLFIEGITKS